jgi:chorismate synthase
MIRFSTAGESHGEALIALVSGLPAGVPVDLDFVNRDLWRRQQGYGRGGRMKIETDKAHILSGVRHGKTIGSPVAIEIVNRDWKNWEEKLPVAVGDPAKHQPVASPRPGHADLAGALKYDFPDARYVLERASARESTSRVAAGAFAKLLLRHLGIEVASHVIRVGRVDLERTATWEEIAAVGSREEIVLSCVDEATEARMKKEVEHASRTGDTVGGAWGTRGSWHLRQLG